MPDTQTPTQVPPLLGADQFTILEAIREQIEAAPDGLEMSSWHSDECYTGCGTAHCLAGWAQFLAGDMDADPQAEGMRLIPAAASLFSASNTLAKVWLQTRAWLPENRPALHAALRAAGVDVATDNEIVDISGGECWSDGNSRVKQSGGVCRSYGNSTVKKS